MNQRELQVVYFLGNLSGNDCEANGIAAALDTENFGESRQSSVETLEVWL